MSTDVIVSKDTMSSLEIAELTGKPHNDVMKAIRRMEPAWANVNGGNFSLVEYKDAKGEMRPCYELTKIECLYIATKFNDEARAKLVVRWDELERLNVPQVPQSFSEALMLAAKQQEELEKSRLLLTEQKLQIHTLTNTVTEMQSKVSYLDRILQCKSTVKISVIAQDYGMSAKAFNMKLHELRIQYRIGKQWILYAEYLNKGYVQSKMFEFTRNNGSTDVNYNTEWTQKGRLFLYETLKANDIIPLIEQ